MNPLLLFLFCFLAISFSLILVQRDLSKWQKFSLVLNPALLALCVLILISKSQIDQKFTADVAPVVNTSIDLLAEPGSPEALEAAKRIRAFVDDPADKNWQNLNSDLQKIVKIVVPSSFFGNFLAVLATAALIHPIIWKSYRKEHILPSLSRMERVSSTRLATQEWQRLAAAMC